jgi:hypothetical protein
MNDDNEPLCEKLLLLLLDRDGKLVSGSATGYLLAGALLADLVLRGRVDMAGQGDPVKPGRVLVRSPVPTGDSLLDDALDRVQRKQGDRPSSVIGPLSKGTRRAVLERLITAGTIREASRNVLGLFPIRSWPSVDRRPAERARHAVHDVVEHGMRPGPETAVLISLLLAGGVLHKVQPTTDRKAQKQRAEQLAQTDWASTATLKALRHIAGAVSEAVMVVATDAVG